MDLPAVRSPHPPSSSEWFGKLRLRLNRNLTKTFVRDLVHEGPLRIQRPFYPEESGCAHIYLLHPPGGVAGGDRLSIEVEVSEKAHALVTAPAANKLYRSAGAECSVDQELVVEDGAFLEWLPQETIAFSGARAKLATIVRLEEGAIFFGWELMCLGRPASQESFECGSVDQRIEVWREETPLYVDRLLVGENAPTIDAAWGLNKNYVTGTVVIACEAKGFEDLVQSLLEQISKRIDGWLACSALRGVFVVRYVGKSVEECWKSFVALWKTVRPHLCGSSASPPRIWSY